MCSWKLAEEVAEPRLEDSYDVQFNDAGVSFDNTMLHGHTDSDITVCLVDIARPAKGKRKGKGNY